jgi:hypothetical protein
VALPIIGLTLGTVLLTRKEREHGLAIVAISLFAGVAGAFLWREPLLISIWVTGVIAVFGVPLALLLAHRATRSEAVWDGAQWTKR